MTLSSRGPGHRPFTAVTRVRIPLGSLRLFVVKTSNAAHAAGVNWKVTSRAAAFVHQLSLGGNSGRKPRGAGSRYLAADDLRHYRELATPQQAKTWFTIAPEASAERCADRRCAPQAMKPQQTSRAPRPTPTGGGSQSRYAPQGAKNRRAPRKFMGKKKAGKLNPSRWSIARSPALRR